MKTLAIDARQFDLESLKKLKIGLKQSNIDYKWVPQDSLHIDLLTVEDFDRDQILNVVSQIPAFTLKLDGVWAYPEQKEARVLWTHVQNSRELQQLRFELFKSVPDAEINNSSDYKPILPIVRFRNYRSVSDLISPFKNTRFPELIVDKLLLIEMVSGGAYPTYKIIDTFPLGEARAEKEKGPEGPVITF